MTLFWIIAGAAALVVTTLLVLALMRGRRETGPAEAYDLKVYRDQLSEIDRDCEDCQLPVPNSHQKDMDHDLFA